MISLSEAAEAAGVSRSTMLRAIKKGKISAVKNETGGFEIDLSELCRVWPGASLNKSMTQGDVPKESSDAPDDATILLLRAQLEAERQLTDELRSDRDAWREQAQRLALPKPDTNVGILARLFGKK